MDKRQITDGVYWMGAIDWDRRIFDSLVPLPDGTSYNAYLIEGSEKTVLLDTVDPPMADKLMAQLDGIPKIDFVVAHHAEQDHSGSIPLVLERFPEAKVICTPKAQPMLVDLLEIPESAFVTVKDGEKLSLGDKTLTFVHTPWVHWPETMVSYLEEERILFSCDFFACHIASADLFVTDQGRVHEAAKRFFAQIMMPFTPMVVKNLEKVKDYDIRIIAPSHGPIHDQPAWIIDAYHDWVSSPPRNMVVLPYVTMHASTEQMVDYLAAALVRKGVRVERFNLLVTDTGKLAKALVDAATVVIGTPTVLGGPHPLAAYCAILANALRPPKTRFLSVIGSYGWGGRTVETLTGLVPNLKAEVLDPVLCKGVMAESDAEALDNLAATIAQKHKELNLV